MQVILLLLSDIFYSRKSTYKYVKSGEMILATHLYNINKSPCVCTLNINIKIVTQFISILYSNEGNLSIIQ